MDVEAVACLFLYYSKLWFCLEVRVGSCMCVYVQVRDSKKLTAQYCPHYPQLGTQLMHPCLKAVYMIAPQYGTPVRVCILKGPKGLRQYLPSGSLAHKQGCLIDSVRKKP